MKVTLQGIDQMNSLRLALAFAAKEDVRFYLNGFLLEGTEEPDVINLVATDGHRLMFDRITLDARKAGSDTPKVPQVLPDAWEAATVKQTIIGLDKRDRKIPPSANEAIINTDPGTGRGTIEYLKGNGSSLKIVTCNIIDGRFPDYNRVMFDFKAPKHGTRLIGFNAQYLGDIAAAMKLPYGLVLMHLDGKDNTVGIKVPEHGSEHLQITMMPTRV